MPRKYLKISDEDWGEVDKLIAQEREDHLNRLAAIKAQVFGRSALKERDLEQFLREFRETYDRIYTETAEALRMCIERVEELFESTKPADRERFDFTRALFEAQHEKDECAAANLPEPEPGRGERERDYEYALKFRRDYHQRVLEIAKLWSVRLLREADLPAHRKNVIRCEESGAAFMDLKRRRFFGHLDAARADMQDRIEVIRRTLITLDRCHKQTQRFIKRYGKSVLRSPEEEANVMDSDQDSERPAQQSPGPDDPRGPDGAPKRPKRTVLDGVQRWSLEHSRDVWEHPKIKRFIEVNASADKRKGTRQQPRSPVLGAPPARKSPNPIDPQAGSQSPGRSWHGG